MLRRTAIYFAKEAYSLWLHNGIKKAGFEHVSNIEGVSYKFTTDGWTILLRQNGALHMAVKHYPEAM